MLTVDNMPKALCNITLQENNHYKLLRGADVIAGKSIVVNRAGRTYLYMSDDPREGSDMIIVHDFGGNLVFLDKESKVAIELKYNP